MILSISLQNKIIWNNDGFYITAGQSLDKQEPISINYWEVLGSVSSLIDLKDLSKYNIDPIEYNLRKESTISTSKILLNFGQIPENSLNHTNVIVPVHITFDDIIVERILFDWYSKLSMIHNGIVEIRLKPHSFPENFMIIARMVSLSFDELASNTKHLIQNGHQISLQNEFKAMEKVQKLLQMYLDSYPIPPSFMEEIRSVHTLQFNKKLSMRLRLHDMEQQVIQSVLDTLTEKWNALLQEENEK